MPNKMRGWQKCLLKALKPWSPLMCFWPSAKGHSHRAEEMPYILASGFVSLYFFWHRYNSKAFLSSFFFFFTVQSTQVFKQVGKDSHRAKSSEWQGLIEGLCCCREAQNPKANKQKPTQIQILYKMGYLGVCVPKHTIVCPMRGRVNAVLCWACWLSVSCAGIFRLVWLLDPPSDFQLFEDYFFKGFPPPL